MEIENPVFGYALLPSEDQGFYLFVPLSDSLKAIINGLHNALILRAQEEHTETYLPTLETEYGGCIALNAAKIQLESIFRLCDNSITDGLQSLSSKNVNSLVGTIHDYHEAIMKSCNKEGNCKVIYHKEGSIVFKFEDMDSQKRKTLPMHLREFHTVVNKAYSYYVNNQ